MNLPRETILAALRTGGGAFVTGASLGRSLGLSRAAVWKHVQALRSEGYTIDAAPRRGYRLADEPDRLCSEALARQGIRYYPVVDSTNSTARALADGGASGGTIVAAEEQRQGRGRRGRTWASPPGKGLWFSLILRPPPQFPPSAAAPVTLVTAAALALALRKETGLEITLKWPNDLLIGGKKVCGILTEMRAEPDTVHSLIVGVGLNVNQEEADFPAHLDGVAVSLRQASGHTFRRGELLPLLAGALQEAYSHFFKEGFAPFRELWLSMNDTPGAPVTVTWPGGAISGTAAGLDESGALIIEDESGRTHRVGYGELSP